MRCVTPDEQALSLANLKLERDAIILYDRLAGIERDPRRAAAFRTIATNERRHADIWAERLHEDGAIVPPPEGARLRIRFIVLVARLFGTASVSELVKSLEGDEEEAYLGQDHPDVAAIIDDERAHAEIWRQLDAGDLDAAVAAGVTPPTAAVMAPSSESWHVSGRSGTLRASIFGISDGLVSNLSLVMGVVGANANDHVIVLAAWRACWLAPSRWAQAGGSHAEPARALRAPDRARARGAAGDARTGGGRAGCPLPAQGHPRC
jgi:hypothetical protein